MRPVLSALLAALASTVLLAAPARAADCAPSTVDGVRILELSDSLGCDRGAELAARTVLAGGYHDDDAYYCRWGQGGTRPIKRRGKTFYAGFCASKATDAQAGFLARPPLKRCRGTGSADVRARYIDCPSARKVYRRSLRVGGRDRPGSGTIRFRYLGYDWRCRARQPNGGDDGPVLYEWSCRARDDVLVRYRLFGGDSGT